VPDGGVVVFVARPGDAPWLNAERPLFAMRRWRAVIWFQPEAGRALLARARDFEDWSSLFRRVPAGPAPRIVEELRSVAHWPGLEWFGGGARSAIHEAFPGAAVRVVDAGRPYQALFAEAAHASEGWLLWEGAGSLGRIRRARWAMAQAGHNARNVFVDPGLSIGGWWPIVAQLADLDEAAARLGGRLAALLDLEPEAIDLAVAARGAGVSVARLSEAALSEDPDAALVDLALGAGVLGRDEIARMARPGPALRFALSHRLDILPRPWVLATTEAEPVHDRTEEVWAAWAAWARGPVEGALVVGDEDGDYARVERRLRARPTTKAAWAELVAAAIELEEVSAAATWAEQALDYAPPDPSRWAGVLLSAGVSDERRRPARARRLLRRALALLGPDEPLPSSYAAGVSSLSRLEGDSTAALEAGLEATGRLVEAEAIVGEFTSIFLGHPQLCRTIAARIGSPSVEPSEVAHTLVNVRSSAALARDLDVVSSRPELDERERRTVVHLLEVALPYAADLRSTVAKVRAGLADGVTALSIPVGNQTMAEVVMAGAEGRPVRSREAQGELIGATVVEAVLSELERRLLPGGMRYRRFADRVAAVNAILEEERDAPPGAASSHYLVWEDDGGLDADQEWDLARAEIGARLPALLLLRLSREDADLTRDETVAAVLQRLLG